MICKIAQKHTFHFAAQKEGGLTMAENRIITIGREFGSGGHEIGNRLATRLNIPLYDNNLIRMVAEKLDIREETARAVDETTLNSFLTGFVLEPIEQSSLRNGTEYVLRSTNRCMSSSVILSEGWQTEVPVSSWGDVRIMFCGITGTV